MLKCSPKWKFKSTDKHRREEDRRQKSKIRDKWSTMSRQREEQGGKKVLEREVNSVEGEDNSKVQRSREMTWGVIGKEVGHAQQIWIWFNKSSQNIFFFKNLLKMAKTHTKPPPIKIKMTIWPHANLKCISDCKFAALVTSVANFMSAQTSTSSLTKTLCFMASCCGARREGRRRRRKEKGPGSKLSCVECKVNEKTVRFDSLVDKVIPWNGEKMCTGWGLKRTCEISNSLQTFSSTVSWQPL